MEDEQRTLLLVHLLNLTERLKLFTQRFRGWIMRTSTIASSKRKLTYKSDTDAKTLTQDKHPVKVKVMNSLADRKRRTAKNPGENASAIGQDSLSLDDVVVHDDLWTLKYNINENGIGKILLPPSLSILLQSDEVSISPSAVGLFIRSI